MWEVRHMEDLIKYIAETKKKRRMEMWEDNIFWKSIEELVTEGMHNENDDDLMTCLCETAGYDAEDCK